MSMQRASSFILAFVFAATSVLAADWQPVGPGVEYQEFAEGSHDIHVTRVDLTNDRIRVIASRESERGMKVSDYAKKNKAIVAINADYFDETFKPVGLTVGPCGQWAGTKDTGREGVVAIGGAQATIQRQREIMDPPPDWVESAVSGWPALVMDCKALTATELPGSDVFTRAPHPRTAVGLSDDRKTLYLLVADGRRTGVPGLTLAQLAFFMASRLHICSAINLDGGGSTTMWVGDKVVNRPSDGVERKVGDHLAVILRSDYTGCDTTNTTRTASTTTAPSTTTSTTSVTSTTTSGSGTMTPGTPGAQTPTPAPTPTTGASTRTPAPVTPSYPGPSTNPPKPRR